MWFPRLAPIVALLMVLAPLGPGVQGAPDPFAASEDRLESGRALVVFHDGHAPDLAGSTSFHGLDLHRDYTRLGYVSVFAASLDEVAEAVAGDHRVAYFEPDYDMFVHEFIPNDPRYGSQYGPRQMGTELGWELTLGALGVVVAVSDTGIMRSHQDFAPGSLLQGYDYADNDPEPNDACGHGTHVSGTVAAWTHNGVGVAGMSQSTILPMKTLDTGLTTCSGSTSDIIASVRDATDQGADIISMSLGGGGYQASFNNAINDAWDAGVLVVASAGNSGGTGCNDNCVGYPAAYANAIAVAATSSSKGIAGYSSRGPQVEIAAPGSSVLSTYNNGGYASLSGTSMAAPHVSGGLALALSFAPGTTNDALRAIMVDTAEDLGDPGHDVDFGHGLMRVDLVMASVVPGAAAPDNNVPRARFVFDLDGPVGEFDASSSSDPDSDPLSYTWDFGDGATATGAAVSHPFAQGTYDVTLTVSDGLGGTTSLSQSIVIDADAFPDPDPSVLEIEPGEVTEGYASESGSYDFKFLAPEDTAYGLLETTGPSCTVPGIVCPLVLGMDVAHGAKATPANARCSDEGTGARTSCLIGPLEAGWWFIRIFSESGEGDFDLTVGLPDAAPGATDNGAPAARVHYVADELAFTLNGSISTDPDGDALSWSWDFGDGATDSGSVVSHTYATEGNKTVSATVDDGNGGTSTIEWVVGAFLIEEPPENDPPVAAFSFDVTDLTVVFDGSATEDPNSDAFSLAWDFGDGNTALGITPMHVYAAAGDYTVTLTATDEFGAEDVVSDVVTVTVPDDPDASVPNLDKGQTVTVAISAGDSVTYKFLVSGDAAWLRTDYAGPSCTLGQLCQLDADMYVKQGAAPTTTDYDCAKENTRASGTCLSSTPGAVWWWVTIIAESGSGNVELSADWGA